MIRSIILTERYGEVYGKNRGKCSYADRKYALDESGALYGEDGRNERSDSRKAGISESGRQCEGQSGAQYDRKR